MPITTNLNTAPYFEDYDERKKYYRILFASRNNVQARELTQIQTMIQTQIERFANNIFQEGSIVEGCSFSELSNLKYVKVIDGINPLLYRERVEFDGAYPVEYWYELEGATSGLKAFIVTSDRGFVSDGVDLNTFYINYLNTNEVGGVEQKEFIINESLLVREFKLITQEVAGSLVETVIDNGVVASTNVASVSEYVGKSLGLTVSSGIIYQRGHFILVDEQTIIISKYYDPSATDEDGNYLPHNISVGFVVDEAIVTSQQDLSLLDNANGSPNENAPGADRLMLTPILTAMQIADSDQRSDFFTLRRYSNGMAVSTREVSSYNVIGNEIARRTSEESGDYALNDVRVSVVRKPNGTIGLELGKNVFYANGYRVENPINRFFRLDEIETVIESDSRDFTLDYGGYLSVTSGAMGPITLNTMQNVILYNTSDVIIGYAVVKNVHRDRIYVTPPRMLSVSTSVSDIAKIKATTSSSPITVNPVMLENELNMLVFSLGESGVESLSNFRLPVRVSKSGLTVSANKIVIPASAGETFADISARDIAVTVNGNVVSVADVAFTASALTLTVSAASGTAHVYYNVVMNLATPRTVERGEYFAKVNYLDVEENFSIGIPNVSEVISITDATGKDFTNSFMLVNNQNANYYNHSYIKKISTRPLPANASVLTIKFKAFVPNASGGSKNFFTADSYINVPSSEIPSFVDSTGRVHHLANCIDYRPYRVAGNTYATTEAGAAVYTQPVDPVASTELFANDLSYIIPPDNAVGYVDIVSYGSRYDALMINSYGEIYVRKGVESKLPVVPSNGGDTVIATAFIPSNPALTKNESIINQRVDNEVIVKSDLARRTTMREINVMKETISDLREYVSLSILEQDAKDMLITDGDGLNRFKSGIVVDSFNSFDVANVTDPLFSTAIDTKAGQLIPQFTEYQLKTEVLSHSGVGINDNGKVAHLLNKGHTKLFEQPKATSYRSCTTNFYMYNGTGEISPKYDAGYNTVTTPKVNVNLDLTSSFTSLVNNIQQFMPLSSSSSAVVASSSSSSSSTSGRTTTTTTTTSQTIQNVVNSLASTAKTANSNNVSYLSDFQFEPYMRSTVVKIYMSGLRPNTRHYFFFDETPVDVHVANAKFSGDGTIDGIVKTGVYAAPVRTNANGEIVAVFRIPANTFYVGDRVLEILDVDDYDSKDSAASSKGSLKYHAYNFTATTGSFGIALTTPEYSTNTVTTTNTVTSRSVSTRTSPSPSSTSTRDREGNGRDSDPLAQTFFVKSTGSFSNHVFVTKLDLYFKRKSAVNGVSVMIREVINGYPSSTILPYGKVHLKPAQIAVSNNGTAVTPVVFKAPIQLSTEKEYCFVVMPDNNDPDYMIFTARVGETDLVNGVAVNQDWGEGMLFTSTNDRAWQSYQGEDVKFTLYRANFNSTLDSRVRLSSAYHEFIRIGVPTGDFADGEVIYKKAATATATLGMVAGSEVLSGVVSDFAVGEAIYFDVAPYVAKIVSINAVDGNMIINETATVTGTRDVYRAVSGRLNTFDYRTRDFVVLDESTAKDTLKFEVGDTIIGVDSGSYAVITAIEDYYPTTIRPVVNMAFSGQDDIAADYTTVTTKSGNPVVTIPNISFIGNNMNRDGGFIIYSRSNGVANASKSFITLKLKSGYGDGYTTPMVDLGSAQLFTTQHKLQASYVSKTVTLKDGFDAHDFKFFGTAYRPINTDVDVYVRLKHSTDFNHINENPWIKLELTSRDNVFSSINNENDLRSFEYTIPSGNLVDVGGEAVTTYTNTNGTYRTFKSFQIRVDLKSNETYSTPFLNDYRGIALR